VLDGKEPGQGEKVEPTPNLTAYSPHSHSIVPGGFEVMS